MQRLAAIALLAWAAFATALALSPYRFEWRCLICHNGAAIEPDRGALVFEAPGMARATVPPAFVDRLIAAGTMTLEIELATAIPAQSGPARILSYSAGPYSRNVTIGQERDALIVRLRTGRADRNGKAHEIAVPGVFESGAARDIVVRLAGDGTEVIVDGATAIRAPSARADFASWDPGFDLFLGNESTGDRPWLGALYRVAMTARPDRPPLAEFDFGQPHTPAAAILGVSDLQLPAWFAHLVPLRGEAFQTKDFVLHVGMLLPVGFLSMLAFARARSDAASLAVSALIVLIYALAVEVAQHFTPTRTMSALDFLYGCLGGLVGMAGGLLARTSPAR